MIVVGTLVSEEVALGLGFERDQLGPLRYRVDGPAISYFLVLHLSDTRVASVERYSSTGGISHAPSSSSFEPIGRFPRWVNDAVEDAVRRLIADSKTALAACDETSGARSDSAVLKRLQRCISRPTALQVKRNAAGRVVALRIDAWYAKVDLPGEVGRLSELVDLEFAPCTLDLPPEIGQLRNLRRLKVFSCGLRSVPDQLGDLTALEDLVLAGNPLAHSPSALFRLSKLKRLWLHDCGLSDIPSAIGRLTNLVDLSLSSNDLQRLPRTVGKLKNLTILRLEHNKLETLPSATGQLERLTSLGLAHNRLKRLPSTMGRLTRLAQISLEHNLLRDVPIEIVNLPLISYVGLGHNRIQRWPSSVERVGDSAGKVRPHGSARERRNRTTRDQIRQQTSNAATSPAAKPVESSSKPHD